MIVVVVLVLLLICAIAIKEFMSLFQFEKYLVISIPSKFLTILNFILVTPPINQEQGGMALCWTEFLTFFHGVEKRCLF